MGEVYRATDTRLQRSVAIKVLPEDLASSPAATERFQREARTASVLNHPNICTIYDVGVDPRFIAMELLEGESLQQRLARSPLDVDTLITVATALAEGLESAHGHGFIHRDIKPANIFLTAHGPKLLDFGIAKVQVATPGLGSSSENTRLADPALTDSGATVGTIAYMSPEQLRGRSLDARTDIFSLGLVLYQMATGRTAFEGPTSAAVSGAILYEQPIPPREIVPQLPIHLEELILKALEKDPDDRYQTAADLRADLRRLKREVDPHFNPDPAGAKARTQTTDRLGSTANQQVVAAPPSRIRWIGAAAAALVVAGAAFAYRQFLTGSGAPPSPLTLEKAQIDQLTTTGDAKRPAIAPDGKYLAFVREQNGEFSLHVRQTGTASAVEIVPAETGVAIFGATVSPDSAVVDYVRRVNRQAFELWRVPFLGGVSKRVIEGVHSPIGWSPDGKRFAFVRADLTRGTTAIVILNADGTGERVLAERARPAQFVSLMIAARPSIAPSWSRDGRTLAVSGAGVGANPADGDVSFIDVDTAALRAVPLPSNAVRGLVWYDDGTLILNAAMPDGSLQLHELSSATGQLRPLTRDVNDYDGISLAADGRTLIGSRRERRTELSVIDPSGRTIAAGPRIDETALRTGLTAINWTNDHVLYGAWMWAPGKSPQRVLEEAEDTTGTADEKSLVFHRKNGIWKSDPSGGAATLLTTGDAWNPTITPDNRWVIFLSSRTGIQSPWIVSINGGEAKQIVNRFAGAPGVDVAPDGRKLLFFSRAEGANDSGALICDFEACAHPKLFPNLGAIRLRWTTDGTGITYVDAASQRNLWTAPVSGGAPRQLTHFDERVIVDFDWSRDGSRLVVARRLETNDIVRLQGLQRGTR